MPSTSNRGVCKSERVPASEAGIRSKQKRQSKHRHRTKANDTICNADTVDGAEQNVLNKGVAPVNKVAGHHLSEAGESIQESGPEENTREMRHIELFDRQIGKSLRMISRHLKRSTVNASGQVAVYAGVSKIHGIGIFAGQRIPSGTRIIEYVGELIGKKVADKRERFYKENGILSVYLFKIFDDLIVDATLKGNLARFINHSCSPNAMARISNSRIFIYSTKDINEDEEITFYYNFSTDEHDDTRLPCYCGHDICTKFMG